MKVLHFLASMGTGGIEVLCKNYLVYSSHDNYVVTFWDKGELFEEIQNNTTRVSFLDIKRNGIFNTVKALVKMCVENDIDTIIIHNASPLLHVLARVVKFRKPSVMIVGYAHANAAEMCESERLVGNMVRRPVLSAAFQTENAVVAISESVKQSLQSVFGVPERKITVIYNGIDIKRLDNNEAPWETNENIRIAYVGRLVEEKGVQNTLNTLAALKRKNWEFHIIGAGDYRDALEEQVAQLQIADKVHFWGNRNDVPDLLQHMDCFVHMPVCVEGFGIAVAEAMAAGNVCVCLASGGIPEIITHKKNGYLVNSHEELAVKLEWLMDNLASEEVKRIREKAITAAERFSIRSFTAQLDKLIEDTVK